MLPPFRTVSHERLFLRRRHQGTRSGYPNYLSRVPDTLLLW